VRQHNLSVMECTMNQANNTHETPIQSNGARIFVKDRKTGDDQGLTLVFLHYWGGSSRTWDDVITALPPGHRTVAPDFRGWGDSDKPVDADGYTLASLADDTQHVIETLDLRRYVLVGHSMGGKVAQLLASRRPHGLVGLVLVAPAPPVPLRMPPEALAAMEGAYVDRTSVEQALAGMLLEKTLSPAHREQIIADSLRGGAAAKAAWPRYTSKEDITHEVALINVPTLVIAGEKDRVDSVATLKAELLSRIPHAAMQVLSGTGHLSPRESPEEVARCIQGFVQDVERTAM
jgi:pimeloyl-ACP methyl ester carboxylesterase